MDRNARKIRYVAPDVVALRKESVDRNVDPDADTLTDDVSLSARRAWIEISCIQILRLQIGSLSARRAWIEIWLLPGAGHPCPCRSPQGERG